MGTVISNLKAKFGVDSGDFKKGLKDGEKAVSDFKGAAGGQLEQLASMFGVNMSAVNDAIGTAGKSLSSMGQMFKGAATGGNVLSISLKGLKFALVSTGIGAIVVALGSLIAYFQKTGEGSDKFARILMQVRSIVNNVIDRLAVFGKGLYEIMTGKFKQGWETMTGAFKGIGDEIKEDWKASGDLADRMDALEDKEIALINSLEERRYKSAELRRQANKELEDQKKKLELLNQAEALTRSVYGDQLGIERERLAIMKEKLAMQSSDPTDEQRREIAEQEAKINSLLREQSMELKGMLREKNAVIEANKKLEAQFGYYKNIKLPQLLNKDTYAEIDRSLKRLQHTFIQTKESGSALKEVLDMVMYDFSDAFESAAEGIATGFAEIAGSMAGGAEGMRGWGTQFLANTFGDFLITLGKVAISTGVGMLAIKAAFKSPLGAILAGSALITLGAAIKAKVQATFATSSPAASAAGSSVALAGAGPSAQSFTINLTGKLVAEGRDLVYIIDKENVRKKIST